MNPGLQSAPCFSRNSEGVATVLRFNGRRRNSFRVAPSRNEMRFPRVAKAQPWAGIRERFQRYSVTVLSVSVVECVMRIVDPTLPRYYLIITVTYWIRPEPCCDKYRRRAFPPRWLLNPPRLQLSPQPLHRPLLRRLRFRLSI